MEWTALVATFVGASIAMGSAVLVEIRKDRRETSTEWRLGKRELYGTYLAKLAQVRSDLQLLVLDRSVPAAERTVVSRQTFAGCYELRYQLEVFAPASVVEPAVNYFRAVRKLRDAAAAGMEDGDEECERIFLEVMDTLADVRAAMRLDMGTDKLATT
ncbi:hypothetical protein ACIGJO_11915 [Streptomyces sp. NPDC079020]|uniref:hypothetical protein n=1 Tax=Streptomyces sp. NPDC079020 TaxID=3365722 RepID=UPI0037D26D92